MPAWWEAEPERPKGPAFRPIPELRDRRRSRLIEYLEVLSKIEAIAVKSAHPNDIERAYQSIGYGRPRSLSPHDPPDVTTNHGDEFGEAKSPKEPKEAQLAPLDCHDVRPAKCNLTTTGISLAGATASLPTNTKTTKPGNHAVASAREYTTTFSQLRKFLVHKASMENSWSRMDHYDREISRFEGTRGRWKKVNDHKRRLENAVRWGKRLSEPDDFLKKKSPGPSRLREEWVPSDWSWEDLVRDAEDKKDWHKKRDGDERRVRKL